ncbi:MAG: hypothetical protein QM817_29420 [Archangium sp.]
MARALVPLCVLLSACMGSLGAGTGGGGGSNGTGGGSGAGGGTALEGLPCDVATLISNRCVSCHGATLSGGAPIHLLSRADFQTASLVVPAQNNGERSVERMRSTTSAMPPGAPPPTAEVDAFAAWVTAGMPAGSCGEVDAGPMWGPDPTCLSGRFQPMPVVGDEHGGETMAPGWACIACHAAQDFMGQNPGGGLSRPDVLNQFMGTVFLAPHEKDLCAPNLPITGAVEILDMGGTVRARLAFGTSGNFRGNALGAMPSPYRARVVTTNGTREMATAQTVGDCNTCHTVSGRENAPGRIYLP